MTATIKLNAEQRRRLIALTRCAGSDEARPVLAAVFFDGTTAVATDSYVLAWVDLDGDDVPQRMVSARGLADALRRATAKSEVRLEFGDKHAEVIITTPALFGDETTSTTLAYFTDTKYPPWRQLVEEPSKYKGASADVPHFNPKNLAKVAATAPDSPHGGPLVSLVYGGELKPARIDSNGQTIGLVMPVRA